VNDLEENKSMSITTSIKHLIEMFHYLDLRRFDQIIISKDVNVEINKINKSNYYNYKRLGIILKENESKELYFVAM